MPCTYYLPGEEAAELHGELNRLTRHVCALLREIEKRKLKSLIVGDLAAWWERHKVQDERRKKIEAEWKKTDQIRKKAMSKLSAQERRSLGL